MNKDRILRIKIEYLYHPMLKIWLNKTILISLLFHLLKEVEKKVELSPKTYNNCKIHISLQLVF